MSSYPEYSIMKKEGSVTLEKRGNNITLIIQNHHPRTGEVLDPIIQTVTIQQLNN